MMIFLILFQTKSLRASSLRSSSSSSSSSSIWRSAVSTRAVFGGLFAAAICLFPGVCAREVMERTRPPKSPPEGNGRFLDEATAAKLNLKMPKGKPFTPVVAVPFSPGDYGGVRKSLEDFSGLKKPYEGLKISQEDDDAFVASLESSMQEFIARNTNSIIRIDSTTVKSSIVKVPLSASEPTPSPTQTPTVLPTTDYTTTISIVLPMVAMYVLFVKIALISDCPHII